MSFPFLRNKNILIISPEDWTHLFVSKHHYAITLAKHNKVFFLSPPGDQSICMSTRFANLWELRYTGFIKGLRYFPPSMQRWFMRKKLNDLQSLAGVSFDCVWSFDNSVFYDFDFLPDNVLAISHIVDMDQDFQFEKAAATATICFGVSDTIVKKLKPWNKKSFLIPHGIAISPSSQQSLVLPGANKVKALYAGNLNSRYISREILYRLIDTHQDVDFIFLGSGGADWPRLKNVFFPGPVPYEQLGDYLTKADILLMIYQSDKFPEQLTNSHKVLEYLYSGNAIVSSFMKDYADKSGLLEMASSNDEVYTLFSEVLQRLPFFNNEEHKQRRRAFAMQNTYEQRLREIESYISTLGDREKE